MTSAERKARLRAAKQRSQKRAKQAQERADRKKFKLFYVAHPKIGGYGDEWSKTSLEAAVRHAKDLLEREPAREHMLVVQVVRVVRRQKLPLLVERV